MPIPIMEEESSKLNNGYDGKILINIILRR
jgi:hypothetical protein